MKWTHVCPLLGVTLFACATGENENPNPQGLGTGNETAGSSGETGGGGAGSGTGGSSSGSFAMGGAAQAGTASGGTFGFGGTAPSFSGTFSSAGVATTAGAGGAGGTGTGGANGGGGAGGKASGGAGGKAGGGAAGTGGTAGAGGTGSAMCAGQTIPAKTTWKGSAMPVDGAYPVAKAFDGDNTTRFSSGTKQMGGEWLEIDFGKVVTINQITMFTNNGDFFRHYQIWLSNTSGDAMGTMLKEADGAQGSIVVPLATAKAGQFLRIKQTGADVGTDIAWWSLHELSVDCK
jgi:F5/8 type C domain